MEGYQSLYRRFRPQRFSEVRGQEHVVKALRNAVREGRVGHAYLFSGPRGTGKTSTARILAKALNCEHPSDGEPCGACASCQAVEAGTSFDVHEHDAASSRGIDDMRAILDSVHLGTPGRTKVYILDEVHQLTPAAVAALLKTLEEPPAHVVFVLATTDPQKVPATIQSRTQHLQFHLLAADVLSGLVADIAEAAGLELPDGAVDHVVRAGAGSGRDTLSYLDQVMAAGGIADEGASIDDLVDALIESDTARALAAVASAVASGREVRALAERLVAHLRDGFLSSFAPDLVDLPDGARQRVADQGVRLGPARTVRALELIGATLTEMRHAPDPRVLLDVALVRLTNPAADDSPAALLERIERLERAERGDRPGGAATVANRAPLGGRAGGARPTRPAGAEPDRAPPVEPAPPAPPAAASSPVPPSVPGPAGDLPSRDQLTLAWADQVLPRLKPGVKALFAAGRFIAVEHGAAEFAVPNAPHREKCEAKRKEVEEALAAHFRRGVPLRIVVDRGSTAEAGAGRPVRGGPALRVVPDPEPDDDIDVASLSDAPPDDRSPIDRLAEAFPGAELLEE